MRTIFAVALLALFASNVQSQTICGPNGCYDVSSFAGQQSFGGQPYFQGGGGFTAGPILQSGGGCAGGAPMVREFQTPYGQFPSALGGGYAPQQASFAPPQFQPFAVRFESPLVIRHEFAWTAPQSAPAPVFAQGYPIVNNNYYGRGQRSRPFLQLSVR